jgi:SagB-type dehydrogenase family enzyme
MGAGDTARLYHRLTSYSPDREWTTPADDPLVLQDFVQNDYDNLPLPCKAYPDGLPTTELPRDWPPVATSATAVLAGRPPPHSSSATAVQAGRPSPFSSSATAVQAGRPPPHSSSATAAPAGSDIAARLDLPAVARLLHLSAGVVRSTERRGHRFLFRAAGSAGARFPLELYLTARGIDGVADGVHWYDPVGHALRRVGPPADGDASALIVTGVPWRTGWRYAERGFRHIYWDAGTMLAQTLALADAPRLWTRFPDADLARLVGADGVHEFPVAVIGLGDGEPAIRPQGEAAAGAIDAAPLEFPLVTRAQHAGDGDTLGEPWPAGAPLAGEPPASAALDDVLLQRGSTRRMDAAASVHREVLDFSLAAALRGASVPHFVAIHAVDGLEPGLYRWPDLDRPLRRGPLREQLLHVCMDQDLGRDAAFVVMSATDLARLDDRGYREAQLDAGLVAGRLHIAAHALGIGASGMTFYDSAIEALLGEPLAGLLFTCVGVPTYRSRSGGRPREPTAVRIPEPGVTERSADLPRRD